MKMKDKVIARTENLPCRLTPDELREAGAALAGVVQDVGAEVNRQTDLKAQMKARLTELEARKAGMAITISRGEEYRKVAVEVTHDYAEGVVRKVRMDTGEEFHVRPMLDHERQADLPGAHDA